MLLKLLEWAGLWIAAFVYGAQILYEILREVLDFGFREVFQKKAMDRPTCLDDPTLGTHGFLHLEDVRIHYVASGPEDKPLMLFVHGFPEFWYSWRNQIREFQKDYRVVAIDQRGYGESDKPKGLDNYVSKKLLSDIKQVILALGFKSCILVAHDWGGAVAWTFGRLYPEMVDKLIVMNAPPAPVFQKVVRRNRDQAKMSWYIFFFQLPYLPELYVGLKNLEIFDVMFGGKKRRSTIFASAFENPLSKTDVDAYKYTFSQPGAMTPPVNYYRAALRRPKDRINYDLNYAIPVLLIWGLKDIALSSSILDLTEKDNPSIVIKRIKDAGHFVQMDTPELVNQAMREWLGGHM